MSDWKVWYQPHGKFGRRYFSGSLSIREREAVFTGKKETFTISHAKVVGPKMIGMNSWIHVAYEDGGEPKDAYFLDRKMLGWSGMLGGNETMGQELAAALLV
jgi:hypothetical protein